MIFSSIVGIVHTGLAVVAMGSGAFVLLLPKGGRRHKQLGYVYVVSMLLMLATAFGIYRLFGGFGPFHALALLSLITLAIGMYPALKRGPNWLALHYKLMSWSVAGLYAAFVAEVAVRVFPPQYFGLIVGIGTTAVVVVAAYFIYGKRSQVLQRYKQWQH